MSGRVRVSAGGESVPARVLRPLPEEGGGGRGRVQLQVPGVQDAGGVVRAGIGYVYGLATIKKIFKSPFR